LSKHTKSLPSADDCFDVPKVRPSNGHHEVQFPKYFRDEAWANGMGAVQAAIINEASQSDTPTKKVIFDFTKCRWIDPLPLMSVLLEIANARSLDIPVDIRLPEPDDGPHPSEVGPYQESPNRLLWFLDQEGFFDCLDSLGGDDALNYPRGMHREAYHHLRVTPSYEDARCIPMTLFVVPTEDIEPAFAQESVERLIVGVDSMLDAKVAPQTRERLTYKLRVALQEALHNAQEHAYEKGASPRLLAIYVRYRTGGLGLDTGGRQVFEEHTREERSHCPGLNKDWLAARKGCLEVFVLDRGIGMVRRFELSNIVLSEKYKFNQVMKQTFLEGRSSKPERQTLYGGLHLLHNLLGDTGDFIRALEDGIWFASGAPIIRLEKQTRLLTKERARMQGLAMHFRLAWKAETDYGDKWAKFGQGKESEVWPELSLSEEACALSFRWFNDQTVIDERFGDLKVNGTQGNWILWLVQPHRMKWDILTFISRTVSTYASEKAILVIADIPSYEAETYAAALAEYKVNLDDKWPLTFTKIILCTNRWRFAAVDYVSNERRHGFSKLYEDFTTLKISPPAINPKPRNIRLVIVRWLKWHDSRVLWEEVGRYGAMFIPENVTWGQKCTGQTHTISGYVDFPRTTHNGLCAAIYRAALTRVLGVLPSHNVQMYPLDQLTMTVLREIHSAEIYEPAQKVPTTKLALGSVLVSGSTLDASETQCLDLHFLVHISSPLRGMKPSLLFWLPPFNVKDGPSRLARIGKTATIAPDGWKSFEVPRFDNERNCVGARDPGKTYQDWQCPSPVIVKAGHWSYQGHHDFLTVNIAGAVEAAFLEKNELARFLVRRILPFIGLTNAHVDRNWHRLLEGQPTDTSDERPSAPGYGILVYRSHPSSESVVRRLLEILTQEGRNLAMQRIFPILPVRMRWSGSTLLIPPLVREEIRDAIGVATPPRPVLVFDDATITGRTLHDLRAALSTIGAKQILTMVIANRLRQPADGEGDVKLEYYWRLDVPVMGREGNCPLCHALHLAEGFSSALASNNAKREISDWVLQWGETSPLDNWSKGLRPLPLGVPERDKRYCYRQNRGPAGSDGKYLARIDVIRSTGLVIHVSELHAMTGRDDYVLKKIREHSEPEVRVELAVSQLLLFGNEFDVDVRIALIQVLIRELARLAEGSSHAQLACLVAMGGLGLLDLDAKRQAAKTVSEENWTTRNNYATKVLLSYLARLNLTDPETDAYQVGARLLSTAPLSQASRLRALFLETLSPLGNPHSEAIPLLLDELKLSSSIKNDLVQDALDSLDRLEELVEGLEKAFVRKGARREYEIAIVEWKAASELAMELLRQQRATSSLSERESIRVALGTYLDAIGKVASAYFYRIHSAADYYKNRGFETGTLTQIIGQIEWGRASNGKKSGAGKPVGNHDRVIRISVTGEIDFDSNAEEVWIAWHQGIPGIVLDLMRNAVYASSQIVDPWDSSNEGKADMWVRVDYGKKFVDLTLANAGSIKPDDLLQASKSHRWPPIKEIGGSVDPVDVDINVVGVRIRIPYAAYLNS